MTDTTSYALPLMTVPRAHAKTITALHYDHVLTLPDDRSGGWLLFGLSLLTIPATLYSLTQMWSLISSGSLDHAIRAFVP